jgi:hypothetical protein
MQWQGGWSDCGLPGFYPSVPRLTPVKLSWTRHPVMGRNPRTHVRPSSVEQLRGADGRGRYRNRDRGARPADAGAINP